jgi:hypothetical protein
MGSSIMTSSPANERECADWMRRSGQVECIFNHGHVTGPLWAMSLWRGRPCGACGAQL